MNRKNIQTLLISSYFNRVLAFLLFCLFVRLFQISFYSLISQFLSVALKQFRKAQENICCCCYCYVITALLLLQLFLLLLVVLLYWQ